MSHMKVLDMKRIISQLPDDAVISIRTKFHGNEDESLLTTTHQVDVNKKYGEKFTYLILFAEDELGVIS